MIVAPQRRLLASLLLALLAAAVFAGLAWGAPLSQAQAEIVQPVVTLAPGEVAAIPFTALSLDLGQPLPGAEELAGLNGLAGPEVLKILGNALQDGLLATGEASDALEPQIAIWLAGSPGATVTCVDFFSGRPLEAGQAEELLALARGTETTPIIPPAIPEAIPVHAALGGDLSLEDIQFEALGSSLDPRLPLCRLDDQDGAEDQDRRFAGRGAIVVRNVGSQPVNTYVAYGTIVEPADGSPARRLVAFSVDEGEAVAVAATTAPAESPSPTAAMTVTGTLTLTPTDQVETATPSPAATAIVSGTAVPTETATPAPKADLTEVPETDASLATPATASTVDALDEETPVPTATPAPLPPAEDEPETEPPSLPAQTAQPGFPWWAVLLLCCVFGGGGPLLLLFLALLWAVSR